MFFPVVIGLMNELLYASNFTGIRTNRPRTRIVDLRSDAGVLQRCRKIEQDRTQLTNEKFCIFIQCFPFTLISAFLFTPRYWSTHTLNCLERITLLFVFVVDVNES